MSAGGSDGGPRLVAFDKATGDELGSVDLPRGAIGTPMTYLADGRQHIALTIGGNPPELISLALAREGIAREDVLGDGLYTEAQAERGAVVYERACLICHSTVPGEIIGQGAAPSLLGNAFSERWSGSPVSTLVEVIRQTMPDGAPNSLSASEYEDITAYLLQLNGYDAGGRELDQENQQEL